MGQATTYLIHYSNRKGGCTMGNIIRFNKINQKEEDKTMEARKDFENLIKHLTKKPGESVQNLTPKQATEIAHEILDISKCLGYNYRGETPIEPIIEAFGLKVFGVSKLRKKISGVIYVHGTTEKCLYYDKVIATDKNEPFEHQRFVAAHELGHYLFDCLGNPKYRNKNHLFMETYPKNNHCSEKEIRADRFAAELLMPRELFMKQYIDACCDKRYNPDGSQIFVIEYLARYFKVKKSSIIKRIGEVLCDDND